MPVRDDDAMMIDLVEPCQEEMIDALWKGKGKGGKGGGKGGKGGKGKGKDAIKGAPRPPTSTTSAVPTAQEGWWMRPCSYCHGRHMD
eukprot:2887475-Heterocapsa_arctica.AAC.1